MIQRAYTQCYRFDDLTLDEGRRRVCRGEEEVHLGKLSYDMLRLLVAAAPNVVGHEEFGSTVWAGRLVTPETLTQRVKLLRDALGDEACRPRYVGLVRGQGYRLLPEVTAVEAESPSRRKLAVLPFESLSREPADGYFAVGIHEEILSHLARASHLSVLARTSVRRYQDTDRPIPEIAAELGVSAVMEGSIRYDRNRVRITAQLIDGATGAHLWAESFEHERENSFAVQDDVATRIAAAVTVSV